MHDFWIPVLKRKLNMVAIIFFVATYFGLLPSWQSIIGILAFLVAYSSVYYYNDLLDYELDRKQRYMPSEKLLFHNKFSPKDYIHLLAWLSVIGLAATFLYSPLLGLITTLAILTNHTRTLIRNIFIRELLLAIVEFFNFEAMWVAMYNTLIPGIALPIFLTYSIVYSFAHAVYKLRRKPLLWVLSRWWVILLGFLTIVVAVFSIPFVAKSAAHLFGLLLITIIYVSIVISQIVQHPNEKMETKIESILRSHDTALLTTSAVLLILGIIVLHVKTPISMLPLSTPPEMLVFLSKVDSYQHVIIRSLM